MVSKSMERGHDQPLAQPFGGVDRREARPDGRSDNGHDPDTLLRARAQLRVRGLMVREIGRVDAGGVAGKGVVGRESSRRQGRSVPNYWETMSSRICNEGARSTEHGVVERVSVGMHWVRRTG